MLIDHPEALIVKTIPVLHEATPRWRSWLGGEQPVAWTLIICKPGRDLPSSSSTSIICLCSVRTRNGFHFLCFTVCLEHYPCTVAKQKARITNFSSASRWLVNYFSPFWAVLHLCIHIWINLYLTRTLNGGQWCLMFTFSLESQGVIWLAILDSRLVFCFLFLFFVRSVLFLLMVLSTAFFVKTIFQYASFER